MPRLRSFDIDPVDVDPDGIAVAQTPAGGGAQNLTLAGALTSGGVYTAGDGDAARQISVTAAADDNARTLTITGTDADGRVQTETFTGADLNITTTESTKYWATVTQATVDADTAGNLSIGTVDELTTKTYMLNRHSPAGALVHLQVTGTIDLTVQVTAQDIQHGGTVSEQGDIAWMNSQDTDLVNATGNVIGNLDVGANAMRVLVNSHSSAAECQVYVSNTENAS